ncbi:protein ADP-ribosylarginine hydrolase-like [Xenia sp. Carnegie-2017]|uniref:protein ADP-ribosylarginine hydrolase-like n=1 Tax=Xenia sp. Carnegie-2017 TaxID=2897299 RepID=UPI001F035107|nr:protein ADP-ribosylarginine hydrolase-like [Xenia sp. Carnegie-2017]
MALESTVELSEKYEAVMVLSGVGGALGYKNGLLELCESRTQIHEKLGGLNKIDIKGWRVSDDTVLHIATAEALVSEWATTEELLCIMASKYKKTCAEDMWERAPGQTTTKACFLLQPLEEKGYIIPYNERDGGCGAAMRSMCIDSDSTDILAIAWWGGMYGMKGVSLGNCRNLEYGLKLMELGEKLLNVSKNMNN